MKVNGNVRKFKRHKHLNIGIVVFIFILIYISITIYFYFTKSHLAMFEVQEVSLAKDNLLTAMIIRNEIPIYSEQAGFVNYYCADTARVTKDSSLLSIDETKNIYDQISNKNISDGLSDYDVNYIRKFISDYRELNSIQDYQKLIEFSSDTIISIQELSENYFEEDISTRLTDENLPDTFHMYYAPQLGTVSYNVDSLCGITIEDMTEADFEEAGEPIKVTNRKTIVAANEAMYKLVLGENWKLICKLNEEQIKSLKGKTSIPVVICNDNFAVTPDISFLTKGSTTYLVMSFDKYLTRYLDQRFLQVALEWKSTEGYKIPVTSITEKEFFIVPISYFTLGGNKNELGLVRETINQETGEADYLFVPCTIYHDDGMYYYIDQADFSAGDFIYSTDGSRYELRVTESLRGVYNINKGYAVFRRIELITQNDDYCVIEKNTSYGISLYDHIALDASTAVESAVIY